MKITAIRIKRLKDTGTRLVGLATLTLSDMIALHDIKIIDNGTELFLAMPSRTLGVGKFKDVVHPINSTVRSSIERIIFDIFEKCVEANVERAQFDLIPEFDGILTDQTADNFVMVSASGDFEFTDQHNKPERTSIKYAEKNETATQKTNLDSLLNEDLIKWLEE